MLGEQGLTFFLSARSRPIVRYNISGIEDFAKEMEEKNLGKPKSANKIIHAHPGMDYYTIIDSDVKIFTRNWHEILLKAHKIWRSQAILGAELHLKGFLFKKGGMEFGDLFPFWTLPGGFFLYPDLYLKNLDIFMIKSGVMKMLITAAGQPLRISAGITQPT